MKVNLYNQSGEEIGTVELPDKIFNLKINPDLIHQAVITQKANQRKPLAHAKGRGEVRGGGKKPWRQKGTGRARHGSIRSPIWKGGGVTHGPRKEKDYSKKMNKSARRQALFMALSSKARDGELRILDNISLAEPKTRLMKKILENILPFPKSVLVIQPDSNQSLIRSIRNLPLAKLGRADSLNIEDVLGKKYLVLLRESIPVIEKTYLKNILTFNGYI